MAVKGPSYYTIPWINVLFIQWIAQLVSLTNSYSLDGDLSGGYGLNNRPTGAIHLSVVGWLDQAVSPAVHLYSVTSQLISLLKLYIHSF